MENFVFWRCSLLYYSLMGKIAGDFLTGWGIWMMK